MEPHHLTSSTKNLDLTKLKREYIDEQWTKLLLDWVKICGQDHASLEKVDFVHLVQIYGENLFVQCPLPETIQQFIKQIFPKFQLKYQKDLIRGPYLTATVLLYHCITKGPVNVVINICLYLSLEQQNLVRSFCELLRNAEITVANIDAAIEGAFKSTSEILEKRETLLNSAAKKAEKELETEDYNIQSTLKSLKTPDSNLNKLKAGATQTTDTVKEDSNKKKKKLKTHPSTLRSMEKSDPESKKLVPINQAGTMSTLYLNSKVTIQSSDCESLRETSSWFRNVTGIALESCKPKHAMRNSTGMGEERNKKINSRSIGLQSLENADLHSIKLINTDSEEIIDTLYLESPILVKSSALGYSGETSFKIESVGTMTMTTVAESNDFIKRDLHVASTKVLLNYIKDNGENKTQGTIYTLRKPDLKPKKTETNAARKIISKIFTSRLIDRLSVMKYSEPEITFLATGKSTDIQKNNLGVPSNLDDEKIVKEMIENDDVFKYILEFLKIGHKPEAVEIGEIFIKNTDYRSTTTYILPSNECLNRTKPEIESDTKENIETDVINGSKTQSTSLLSNQPDRIAKTTDMSATVEEIDTLHLNRQFMTKPSAFGYLAKTRSEKRRIVGLPLTTADEFGRERKRGLERRCGIILHAEEERDKAKETDNSISGNLKFLKQCDPESKKITAGITEGSDPGDIRASYSLNQADLERNCLPSRMKTVTLQNSNEAVEKGPVIKWHDLNVWKDAIRKMLIEKQETELNNQGKGENTSNLDANRNEDKPLYYLYRFQGWSMKKLPSINTFRNRINENMWEILIIACAIMIVLSIILACLFFFWSTESDPDENSNFRVFTRQLNLLDSEEKNSILFQMKLNPNNNWFSWECKNGLCQKANQSVATGYFKSLSRCTLLCTGPQLWPYPTGLKFFGKRIVALAKNKLSYKYKKVPSQTVNTYLNKTFMLFQSNLARLEVTDLKEPSLDLDLKELYIEIDVDSDRDPRLRLDTNESYALTVNTTDKLNVAIKSPSFCGVRHGLETLSQLILLDQSTGHLITLTNVTIIDTPSYKYRGLMIDTARNCIPLIDLLRTIDTMSMSKLNTFHWRVSDATFPMLKNNFPQLFEYTDYEKEMVYTTDDVELLVKHAGYRGIRVLMEVAAPEPVNRAFSWIADATKEKSNLTSNALCLKLKMLESVFPVLEAFYSYIIKLTEVKDVFHLSNSLYLFVECFDLMEDRERFLEKAQADLRSANNGILPKLPVIWYNANLTSKLSWMWYDFGVQLHDDKVPDSALSKYKLIQSSRWNLSCKMTAKHRCVKYKTWQEMYGWKKWRNLDALSIEGGETILWTDLVDTNNLDAHLWPRASAVAERLWSDTTANHSASVSEYLRIDAQRCRMLIRGVKVQPIWPMWCSSNPDQCLLK